MTNALDLFANPGAAPAGPTHTDHHRFPLPPETRAFRPSYDRYGRYSLPHPETGAVDGFTRVTTGAKTLDDSTKLEAWKLRSVVRGIKTNPHILENIDLYADAADVDKDLTKAAEDAHVAAGGVWAAEFGTAIHAWLEALELRSVTWDQVPDQFKPFCEVYGNQLVKWGISSATDTNGDPLIERIVWNPDTNWIGTFDRIYQLADQRRVIGDVKTAKDLAFSALAISVQLFDYHGATHMLSLDGTHWLPMPETDPDYAVVAWVPSNADPAKCEMVTINLAAGRLAAEAAVRIREMRSAAKRAILNSHPIPRPEDQVKGLDSLRTLIRTCTSRQQLAEVYAAYSHAWTDELTELGNSVLAKVGG